MTSGDRCTAFFNGFHQGRMTSHSPSFSTGSEICPYAYHASHADRISAASLRASGDEEEGQRQFRIANGYDAVLQWLRAGIDPQRSEMRLGTEVTEVRWKRGEVAVQTRGGEVFRASAAVITIPLGVWKASDGIVFEPPLRDKQRAIEKLEVGHVVRIVVRFRERFWEEDGNQRLFVHSAADRFMRTWWTAAPVRAPLLTGWAGGYEADALLAEGTAAISEPNSASNSQGRVFQNHFMHPSILPRNQSGG